jgi:hypothetical protein
LNKSDQVSHPYNTRQIYPYWRPFLHL